MRRSCKSMRLLPLILLSAPVAGALLAACSSDECLENKNSLPLAGFYSSEAVPQAISIDSISIYGVGAPGDSILHDSVRGLSETYLPFRIDQDSTVFVIRYLQEPFGSYGIEDTITFRYDILPDFVSAACGAVYDYRMRQISTTHFLIDSVTCPDGTITNLNAQNLRIYFRVAVEDQNPPAEE